MDEGNETKCPSCGKQMGSHFIGNSRRCFHCGRALQDLVSLILKKGQCVSVKIKWPFHDIEGKRHEVTALMWGDLILHFGEDGLYTDIHALNRLKKKAENWDKLGKILDLIRARYEEAEG